MIDASDQRRTCPNCGADTPVRGRFCNSCGVPLPQTPPSPAPSPSSASRYATEPAGLATESAATLDANQFFGLASEPSTPASLPAVSTAPSGRMFRLGVWIPVMVVLVVVVALGVFFTVRWFQERPVHQALENSHTAFAAVEKEVAEATELPELNDAGSAANNARDTIAKERDALGGRGGEFSDAARGVLLAQEQYLDALGQLADLDESTLTSWGDTSKALENGEENLESAVAQLAKIDGDAAERVAPDSENREHVASVVGAFSAESLAGTTNDLLLDLVGAEDTERIREVARTANDSDAVVEAALSGLTPGSEQAEDVEHYGDALDHIARLESIDRDHLARWRDLRGPLDQALAAAPDLDAAAAASSAISRIVTAGQRKMRAWRAEYDAERRSRDADLRTLNDYEATVSSLLRDYTTEREEMSDFVDEVEINGMEFGRASEFLQTAVDARTGIRDGIAFATPPRRSRIDHFPLVDLLDRATSIVEEVRLDFAARSPCLYCYPSDIDNWTALHTESDAITTELGPARSAWNMSVTAARLAIQNRPLPAKPEI